MPLSDGRLKLILERRFFAAVTIILGLYIFAAETGNEWVYFLSGLALSALLIGFFTPLLQVLETDLHFSLPSETVSNERLALRIKVARKGWWGAFARFLPIKWMLVHIELKRLGEPENMIKPILVEHLIKEAWVVAQTPRLRRGVYNLEAIEMMSCYPFGLAWWVKTYPLSTRFSEQDQEVQSETKTNITAASKLYAGKTYPQMVVFPRTDNIAGNFLYRLRAAGDAALFFASSRPMAALSSSSVRSLREFRLGDSPRFIHWPTSAKTGKLMIREFESEGLPAFDLLLDLTSEWKTEEQFELAVSTTLSLMQLGFRLGGSPELFILPSTESDLEKLPTILTDLPPAAPGIGWASQILARVEALQVRDPDYIVPVPRLSENNSMALLCVRPSAMTYAADGTTVNDKECDVWVLSRIALEADSDISNREAKSKPAALKPIPLHAKGSEDRRGGGESALNNRMGRVLGSISEFEEMAHL